MVGLGRFELPTSRLSGVRSNQLSYRPCGFCGAKPNPIALCKAKRDRAMLNKRSIPDILSKKMVELDGIEPTTSCLQSRRSPN